MECASSFSGQVSHHRTLRLSSGQAVQVSLVSGILMIDNPATELHEICFKFVLYRMKLFPFILAIYLASLAIVPCTDGIVHSTEDTTMEVSSCTHDHDHSGDKDGCTPLCTCICCGSLAVMPHSTVLNLAGIDLASLYQYYYSSNYSFEYSQGVWHPPTNS